MKYILFILLILFLEVVLFYSTMRDFPSDTYQHIKLER